MVFNSNVLSLKQKVQLTNYLDEKISGNTLHKQKIVIIANEEICSDNLFFVYRIVTQIHPNYVNLVFNSRNSRLYKPLAKILKTCEDNECNYVVVSKDELSSIVDVVIYPLALLIENGRVVAGINIDSNGYEQINNLFSSFEIWW